jgi:hypothetical protein
MAVVYFVCRPTFCGVQRDYSSRVYRISYRHTNTYASLRCDLTICSSPAEVGFFCRNTNHLQRTVHCLDRFTTRSRGVLLSSLFLFVHKSIKLCRLTNWTHQPQTCVTNSISISITCTIVSGIRHLYLEAVRVRDSHWHISTPHTRQKTRIRFRRMSSYRASGANQQPDKAYIQVE